MSATIRPSGVFDTTYEQDLLLHRTRSDQVWAILSLVAVLAVPLLTREGLFGTDIVPLRLVGTIQRIAILMVTVQGLNLLVGYTGQISLGQAAFMAVGAYTATILMRQGITFWLALPVGTLFAGIVGLIFGLPSLRVKGFYLAMATLAAQFIIPWLLRNPLEEWTNGFRPLEVPEVTLGPLELGDTALYYVIIIVAFLAMIAARNIVRTRTGRALVSIRDNDLAAELLGIDIFAYKLRAFFLCALYAGLAGGLLAIESGSITPVRFDLNNSIEYLAMLIIGGAGYPQAAFFGAGFVLALKEVIIPGLAPFLREILPQLMPFTDEISINAALTPILFGLALILFLVFEPHGLAHRWEILKIWWKLRPFAH
jgi:branched-chain amino acid transport system permease protein